MTGMDSTAEGSAERNLIGVVIVDHGSRRIESNELLTDVVDLYRQTCGYPVVEPAHMELADPSIETAVARCVAQGVRRIVVFPYFLSPGRHWDQDIPRLAQAAAEKHAGVSVLVTAPLGLHPFMLTEAIRKNKTKGAAFKSQMTECFLCGVCSAVCPSDIPLVQSLEKGKQCL